MGVPLSQMWTVATYVMGQRLRGRRRYPLVLMLEPLFRCNLACAGCGKIQYPAHILKQNLSVEDCLKAVDECGAPMVSIPGGEPLMQTDFLVDLASRLHPIHLAIETSGYAPLENYQRALRSVDLVFQDLKHSDPIKHKRYTGVELSPILDNLAWLKASGRPFIARIPLIPGVNDDRATLAQFAELLTGASGLIRVEILPYHLTAGAKYALLGLAYAPPFDPSCATKPDLTAFEAHGILCRVM